MVYNGPSKGCRACRKRRVKCDQGKPACGNCTKRKVECPGYESTFDYRHRNETDSTIQRAQQREEAARRKSTCTDALVPEILLQTLRGHDVTRLLSSSSTDLATMLTQAQPIVDGSVLSNNLYHELTPDPETAVLNWYFSNYPMKSIDPQSTHGFVSLLKPLYMSSPDDSPLRPAVAAVATNLLMLLHHRGSDTDLARKFYAQAITRMKGVITDPTRSKQDDLLLATLALNFYDNINVRWNPELGRLNNHRNGALALLRHRGLVNTQTEVSRHITSCMRTALCHWALDSGTGISPEVIQFLTEASVPTNKATELDILSLKLVDFQNRFNNLYGLRSGDSLNVDQSIIRELIDEGLDIDRLFSCWGDSCPAHWRPLFLSIDEVLPSIRSAGFYGKKCAVYWDLSICDMWNLCRMRRILLLRMVRQLCVDGLEPPVFETQDSVEATIRTLVEQQLETVPFMMGDATTALHYSQMHSVHFPSKSNGICNYPNPDFDHARCAANSGGWLSATLLMNTAKLALKTNNLDSIPLKKSQFDWVITQLGRVQRVYLRG